MYSNNIIKSNKPQILLDLDLKFCNLALLNENLLKTSTSFL